MAAALVESGRHNLVAYTGQIISTSVLSRWGASARPVTDLEEVLADPAIEAVIVAGTPTNRPAQLRRSLQSERHVLCVHPADRAPDVGYEAAMVRDDTGVVLLPLLPDALHPALGRLSELLQPHTGALGQLRLLDVEHSSHGEFLLEPDEIVVKWALPGWDRLRTLGGEIAAVSAMAPQEDLEPGQPLLLCGVFERGGVFQVSLLPHAPQPRWRATATGEKGRIELLFPLGWEGPAFLTWRDSAGKLHEEAFPAWDAWPVMVEAFEAALVDRVPAVPEAGDRRVPTVCNSEIGQHGAPTPSPRGPTWQDVIRCLELDDAARRSVARRRATILEYPEASEEVGFKGTMTLVGCGLLWLILLLLLLSAWKAWLGWFIVPVLAVFILLQGFRWVVRRRPPND
jgi:predicted dehydrogenase